MEKIPVRLGLVESEPSFHREQQCLPVPLAAIHLSSSLCVKCEPGSSKRETGTRLDRCSECMTVRAVQSKGNTVPFETIMKVIWLGLYIAVYS